MSAPKIEELSEQEQHWVAKSVLQVMTWAGTSDLPTAAQLDDIALHRMADDADANIAINVIGVAFGELLRRATGLEWKIVTDEYGTELALYGEIGAVVIVPQSLVAKRWAAKQPFMAALAPQLIAHVAQLRGN